MSDISMHSFYTKGSEFTELLRDFVASGEFEKVILILEDGGLKGNKEVILNFLDGMYRFEGDTREGGLDLILEGERDTSKILTGWRTLCKKNDRDTYNIKRTRPNNPNKNYSKLFDILSEDEFKERYKYDILEDLGYIVHKEPCLHEVHDGVITREGYFVECGFQGHISLYDKLYGLGMSSCNRRMDDTMNLHISSKSYSGKVSYSIKDNLYEDDGVVFTEEQLQAVFKWREHFTGFYSEGEGSVINALRHRENNIYNRGAKYGNLMFLKRYYAFNTPEISTKFMEDRFCIRTSPKRSMPGILNSYFNVGRENYIKSLRNIVLDWKRAEENTSLTKWNKLHTFNQKFIEGRNGVCHYRGKGDFTYDLGDQGQVVKGEVTSKSEWHGSDIETVHNKLRPIARELSKDLASQVQLEFVIHEEEVTIVQLRLIKMPTEEDFSESTNKDLEKVGFGNSFTSGRVICKEGEYIVVDNEVESRDVIGMKAIIVRDNVEFSHALALSQSLNIPSIYNVGNIELPKEFILDTRSVTGLILKE